MRAQAAKSIVAPFTSIPELASPFQELGGERLGLLIAADALDTHVG